jgi:aspartyl aminopeptidase
MDVGSLLSDLDASPTQYHLVDLWRSRLLDAGHREGFGAPRGFVAHGGAVIAWTGMDSMESAGVRIVGAHSDSPGFAIKPKPDQGGFGTSLLGLEVYGSPLLNSWLDRDLRVAGRVTFEDGTSATFDSGDPIARISQLAIHLDRDVNDRGLVLDRQRHLVATWATGSASPGFVPWLTGVAGGRTVVAWDARLVDAQAAALIGSDHSLLASGRLDNQVSCWAALSALGGAEQPSVVAVFDHEEVGSNSATGAAGPLLLHVLEACAESAGLGRRGLAECLSRSHCVSADNAHAVHPAYAERHDPEHAPLINRGVAIKVNSNQRYATDASSVAPFVAACDAAGAPYQWFSSRNTQPCGSTIGPVTATRLGVRTVDVGVPQWSMHSAREVCGASDAAALASILRAYLAR